MKQSEIEIRAIAIKQPWAWCLFHGKDVENRSWNTKSRGLTCIHASMSFDKEGYRWILDNIGNLNLDAKLPEPDGFNYGGIIGYGNLVDVVTTSESPWFFGKYGHVYENMREIPFQPCIGQLKFFRVQEKIQALIRKLNEK